MLREGGLRGLGISEERSYFASIVVVADRGIAEFVERVTTRDADADVDVGAGRLARRGALVRCLAADAPALARTVDAVWTAARTEVLGMAPLGLRKM